MLNRAFPCRTTPRHATPRYATPRHATPRHATPHLTTLHYAYPIPCSPGHASPPHTTPFLPHHATPHRAAQVFTLFYMYLGIAVVFGQVVWAVATSFAPFLRASRALLERVFPEELVDIDGDVTAAAARTPHSNPTSIAAVSPRSSRDQAKIKLVLSLSGGVPLLVTPTCPQ